MATLKYIGTPAQFDIQPESPNDVVTQSYIAYLLTLNLTMPQVTTIINAALAPFATQSYADSDMADLATPAYVSTQESGYLTFNQLNQPNGPIEIQNTGKIAPGQINLPTTQTLPEPFWSPTSYNTGTVTASSTPQQLYTISIPNPGYTYVVFCTGLVDTQVNSNTIQVIAVEGGATGGSFTLTDWAGETTPAIPYYGPDTTIQAYLAALPAIGSGNVAVTGSTGPWTVTFANTLRAVALLEPNSEALTGGTPFIQVSSNGAYPVVIVRQGSTVGQIVAAGYGVAECYPGPLPGQHQSQMTLTNGGTLSGTLTTLTGWQAVNNSTYSTQVVGNYLQIPQSLNGVTLSASLTFTGAAPSGAKGAAAVSTGIQIVTSTGTIVATGTAAVGDSGTATARWTGNVTIGTLYGVQAIETSAAIAGTISSAILTMTPSGVSNVSTANILPVPYDQQQSLSQSTTLYVMLESSDGVTPVQASNFDPALWVMPIPWSLLTSPVTQVTFDSSARATPVNSTIISWNQTLGIYTNCLLVGVGTYFGSGNQSSWSRSATCDGITMTSIGVQANDNASAVGWSELFILMDPPTGQVTIQVTETNSANVPFLNGVSVAYQGVAGVPTVSANYGAATTLAAGAEASTANGMVVALFVGGQDHTITGATTGTERAVGPLTPSVDYCPAAFVDSPGTGSPINLGVSFNSANPNSSLVVNLAFA